MDSRPRCGGGVGSGVGSLGCGMVWGCSLGDNAGPGVLWSWVAWSTIYGSS